MQQNPTDFSLHCDLLALSAMLEAARGGETGLEYALQAARLQSLCRKMREHGNPDPAAIETDEPLQQLEQRLVRFASQQRELGALAGDIVNRAQQDTSALQFDDVESRVVVYSKQRARELRAQLSRIDETRQTLWQGIASDLENLASRAQASEQRIRQRQARTNSKPDPNQQNSLDHDDGEMF